MKKLRRLSLVCAGPISQTSIHELPNLAANLGPVKSANLRVASRIVNTLKAGEAVTDYHLIAEAQLVLLNAVDRDQESTLISSMAGSGADWTGCSVVLYESESDSSVLRKLAGASVATFGPMPGQARLYLFEGEPTAIKIALKMFSIGQRQHLKVTCDEKLLYLSAYRQHSQRLLHLLFEADGNFRHSGLEPQQARASLERLTNEALNLYRKGVRPTTRGESPEPTP